MTDVEQRLRDTLQNRAQDVTEVPASVLAFREAPTTHGPSRLRAGWLVAAAVVAVLVAATVAVLSRDGHPATPPATHPPTVSASPTSPMRATCSTSLPAEWQTALRSGTSTFGATSAMPLAISPDGATMLITRDFGSSRDVATVDPRGHAHRVYSVPEPDLFQVVDASVDGHYAALDLDRLPRNANGVLPSVHQLVLLDLRTRATKVLDRTTVGQEMKGGRTIDRSVMWNGTVYWDVRKEYVSAVSSIRAYSVANHRTTTVGSGGSGGPQLLAAGLVWGDTGSTTVAVPRPLPAGAPASTSLLSDGTAYAWEVGADRIAWWAPGQRTPVTLRLPKGVHAGLVAVVGQFVFYGDGTDDKPGIHVLDALTGGDARTSAIEPFAMAGGGTLLGYRFTDKFKDSATAAIRVDTATLPELRC